MYVAWRTWSHWKARNAASLLRELIAADRLVPEKSDLLDGLLPPTRIVDDGVKGRLLVSRKGIEKLVQDEGLPEASLEEVRSFYNLSLAQQSMYDRFGLTHLS